MTITVACPKCKSPNLVKFGLKWVRENSNSKKIKKQQYLCNACGRITIYPILPLLGIDMPLDFDYIDSEQMEWIVVPKGDIRARGIADRHYSRQTKRAPQFTRPGNNLVLLTGDCSSLWVSWKPANGIKRMDNLGDVYECTIFHRDSGTLASTLIKEAIELTEQVWGKPKDGWVTYIADDKVRTGHPKTGKPNVGKSFLKAGFVIDGRNKKGNLTRLLRKPLEFNPRASGDKEGK